MARGTIKRLVADRGFGFVSEEGRELDLFFHASAVRGATFDGLRVGQPVEFDAEPDPRGGGSRATNVRPTDGAGAEREEARDSVDAEAEGGAMPGRFTVRYESEQQLQEGLKGVSGGTWTVRDITRLPDGSAIAEFASGDAPTDRR